MQAILIEDLVGCFSVWDHPRDGMDYVAGVDVAEGKKRDKTLSARRIVSTNYQNERPDYSAIAVLEMVSGLHVASWHGYVPPDQLSAVACAIGLHYNTALLVPEVNGPGIAVITRLSETLQYPNLYRSKMFNVLDQDPYQDKLGFRTDAITRKLLIARVHEVVNAGTLWTRDRRLIGELRTMEFDDQGTERGRGKNKDDMVFALALALQGRYTNIGDVRARPTKQISPERSLDRMAWQHAHQRQEASAHGARSLGGGLFDRWGRSPWIGRRRSPPRA